MTNARAEVGRSSNAAATERHLNGPTIHNSHDLVNDRCRAGDDHVIRTVGRQLLTAEASRSCGYGASSEAGTAAGAGTVVSEGEKVSALRAVASWGCVSVGDCLRSGCGRAANRHKEDSRSNRGRPVLIRWWRVRR